jgi:uncharacterized lipoprotein YmbA
MMKTLPLVLMLAVVASCASAPDLSYFTIDQSASGMTDDDVNLVVGRFTAAEKLDRHQIVIQETPTRIGYYATDRWASSLGEMVEHKLAVEFGPAQKDRRSLIVEGRIIAFEQVDTPSGPVARVTFEITIREGGSMRYEEPLLEKAYSSEKPAASNSVDAVVQAMSRAVEEIAAAIAADAAGL